MVYRNNRIWQIWAKLLPTDWIMKVLWWKENYLEVGMVLNLIKVQNWVVSQREIVKITWITLNVISIDRAYEPCPINDNAITDTQTELEFDTNDYFTLNVTADDFDDIIAEIELKANDNEVVHYALNETITWNKTFTWDVISDNFIWNGSWLTGIQSLTPSTSFDLELWEDVWIWKAVSKWVDWKAYLWGINFIWITQSSWTTWQVIKINKDYDNNQSGLTIWDFYDYSITTWDIIDWTSFKAISTTELVYDVSYIDPVFWYWSDWNITITNWETLNIDKDNWYEYNDLTIDSWWILSSLETWNFYIKVRWTLTLNWNITLNKWSNWTSISSILFNIIKNSWNYWDWGDWGNWWKWDDSSINALWWNWWSLYWWGWWGWAGSQFNWGWGWLSWAPWWFWWTSEWDGVWWDAYGNNWWNGSEVIPSWDWWDWGNSAWGWGWAHGGEKNNWWGWWGWGFYWLHGSNLLIYVNDFNFNWNININWLNWWNWWDWWDAYQTPDTVRAGWWGWWGWGWWGWGWACIIIYKTKTWTIVVNWNWWNWWIWWSWWSGAISINWGENGFSWTAWTSWTSWEQQISQIDTLI